MAPRDRTVTHCAFYTQGRDAGTGQTGQTAVWPGFPNS